MISEILLLRPSECSKEYSFSSGSNRIGSFGSSALDLRTPQEHGILVTENWFGLRMCPLGLVRVEAGEIRAARRPASPSSPSAPRRDRRLRGCRYSACPCYCWRRAEAAGATRRGRRPP